jgi:hypothetical protein
MRGEQTAGKGMIITKPGTIAQIDRLLFHDAWLFFGYLNTN